MNVLDRICADKQDHIAAQKSRISLSDLESEIKKAPSPKGFIRQIEDLNTRADIALITEVKKASPSKGLIRADFHPVTIATAYRDSGAACLSVLTDEPYFQGKDDYFRDIRAAVDIPLLRKDFMLDPYQIYESRALGADCILIIMAALDDTQAAELYALSTELGMDVLVEVHDNEELERALKLEPAMVGVNNRNLKTLDVDLQNGIDMAQSMPDTVLKVGESGIYSHDDLMRLKNEGVQAFLVGESLMRQENIADAVKKLRGEI